MHKLFLSFTVFIFLMTACSEDKEQTKKVASTPKAVPAARPERSEEQNEEREPDYERLYPEIGKAILFLDSTYARTPYYTRLNSKYIFYVCQGIWETPNDSFKNGKALFGLADENGKVLLPPEYTKIYNPDLTAQGYIEIEKKGKRGLYNYTLGTVIPAEFDVIFPSEKTEFSVIAKKGDQYFAVQGDLVVPYDGEIPTYHAFAEKWKFNVMASDVVYWYDSYWEFSEGDPTEGIGVVFTPSYFHQLGFLPEVVQWIVNKEKDDRFGIVENKGDIVESHSFGDQLYALITSFYEEGIDGRGWQISRNNIVTVDGKNNVINEKCFLDEPDNGTFYYCGKDKTGFHYLDNNLLEVRDVLTTSTSYPIYDYMTTYEYFKVNDNGTIEKQKSSRVFEFTGQVKINESYFNGCFSKHLDEVTTIDGEEGNMWLYDHLTMEDLDLMRNEIYAEYGMKFKTDKWKQYFGKQKWYLPKYDNVDHLLTPIDRHNLKVILTEQARMKGKENEVTQKRFTMYAPAG